MTPPQQTGATLVLVGGGGHGVVVAEAALEGGTRLTGYIDDRAQVDLDDLAPRLGGLGCLDHEEIVRMHPVILALGDLRRRRSLIPRLPPPYATIIHPTAVVSKSARIESGAFIGPRAVVHSRARIGAHAIINTGAIVEHDCAIGENAHLAPGVVLGGNVHVGVDALVGLSACAIPGVRIGDRAVIGAGAAVVKDVEDEDLIVGVPGVSRAGM